MDSSIYIKENLISRIKNSTDIAFLKALQTLFDSTEQELFELSTEQKKSIELSKSDILNGDYKPHDQVMSETEKWLKNQ